MQMARVTPKFVQLVSAVLNFAPLSFEIESRTRGVQGADELIILDLHKNDLEKEFECKLDRTWPANLVQGTQGSPAEISVIETLSQHLH